MPSEHFVHDERNIRFSGARRVASSVAIEVGIGGIPVPDYFTTSGSETGTIRHDEVDYAIGVMDEPGFPPADRRGVPRQAG